MKQQESLYTFFQNSLKKNPNNFVICDKDKQITYQQLNQRINELAQIFKEVGIKQGQFIGVFFEPDTELVAILLTLSKLGVVFVPLYMDYPQKRLHFMIKDAELSYIVAKNPHVNLESYTDCPKLYLEKILPNFPLEVNSNGFLASAKDVCYVIYTSGTTGEPKGVLVNYAGAINTILQSALAMDIQDSHRLLQLSPISFDVFILEVGMVIFSGATLVFAFTEQTPLDKIICKNNIQHILCTPNTIADIELANTPLHAVMFGGEPLPETLVNKYAEDFRIIHAYGVTEATICSTLYLCKANAPVSMGEPLENTYLELLDENQQPISEEEVGEIVVSGMGVSNGYINRPIDNSIRFIPDPNQPNKKRFRTGDLAKKDKKGNLFFMGRNDRQIKYKEHRLELTEVETLLLSHPEVTQAALLLKEEQLWAFVCLKTGGFEIKVLKNYLKNFLLEQLIPKIKQVDSLPLTPHNKINYLKLSKKVEELC